MIKLIDKFLGKYIAYVGTLILIMLESMITNRKVVKSWYLPVLYGSFVIIFCIIIIGFVDFIIYIYNLIK